MATPASTELVGHVAGVGGRACAGGPRRGRALLGLLAAEVDDRDRGALAREALAVRPADPLGTAGDDRDLAGQPHRGPPRRHAPRRPVFRRKSCARIAAVPGWAEMVHNGIQGWIARERDAEGRWTASPEHTWMGAAEVELDPADDRDLWAKRGSGNLASWGDGRTGDLFSRAELGSYELYLEFMIPAESRSGVYLLGRYKIEIADTNELSEDELTPESCGGIPVGRDGGGHVPLANAALPFGEWQTLQVVFRAPRFDDDGRKVANARFERVLLNDVLIHESVECAEPSPGALSDDEEARGPLRLQGSEGPVAFRDVRMRTLFE
jgi:hypothetical protein